MFFLFKCLFWLLIVFVAIGVREPPGGVEPKQPERAAVHPPLPPKRPAPSPTERAGGALSELADQATAKFMDVARGECLAHPLDCLRAAERFGRGTAESEPARR